MKKVRYCWLTPELKFSESWSEKDHEVVDEDIINNANEKTGN